ncbi:hypothetical protein GCM10025734_75920 [Kitasatospora paranensis]
MAVRPDSAATACDIRATFSSTIDSRPETVFPEPSCAGEAGGVLPARGRPGAPGRHRGSPVRAAAQAARARSGDDARVTTSEIGPAAPPVAPPVLDRRQRNIVFGTILLGMLLAALDQTIVGTALPTIVSTSAAPRTCPGW